MAGCFFRLYVVFLSAAVVVPLWQVGALVRQYWELTQGYARCSIIGICLRQFLFRLGVFFGWLPVSSVIVFF